jgi:(2R)-sulfolactate sulfo-lyase subunit beta
MVANVKVTGFRRPGGRFGIRNHVVIIPVDDISNAAAEAVARLVNGTLALPHPYGRLQFGVDLALHWKTLIGSGRNPNVAAVVVIGIEPAWTGLVADGIAQSGKPVASFSIEGNGDISTIMRATRAARDLVGDATAIERTECSLADLVVGIKCGESDTTSGLASNPALGVVVDRLAVAGGTVLFGETTELTGAEGVIAGRTATPELRERFEGMFREYADVLERDGQDLMGSQPSKGNIAGGLTTIEEKAYGNIQKTGSGPVVDVLEPADPPTRPGINFMNTSSAGAECVTLMGAAGAVIHFFTTGQGNPVGNPIVPVVKICANPQTVQRMAEHIDVDIHDLLMGELTLGQAADRIVSAFAATARGRLTAAEILGHREFILTRLHRSA